MKGEGQLDRIHRMDRMGRAKGSLDRIYRIYRTGRAEGQGGSQS